MSIHSELSPEAQEALKKQKTLSTVVSIAVSLLSVLLLGVLLALLFKIIPSPEVETIISYQATTEEVESVSEKKIQTTPRKTVVAPASASAATNVITSTAPSSISIPDSTIVSNVEAMDFGEFDDFGDGMSFGEGSAAMTSFFGATVEGNRIAYVIDYSASMRAQGRDELMRKELTDSVKKLSGDAEFALIFFAGPVWDAGSVVKGKATKSGRGSNAELPPTTIVGEDGKVYEWGSRKAGAQGKKQKMTWRKTNNTSISAAVSQIKNTPLIFGTQWDISIDYALDMNPKPDVIVFMTDGTGGSNADLIAEKARKKGVVINSIALLEPKAKEGIITLGKETGGSATMVEEGGKIIDLLTGEPIKK